MPSVSGSSRLVRDRTHCLRIPENELFHDLDLSEHSLMIKISI